MTTPLGIAGGKKTRAVQELRPTLLIGLGGTGTLVMTHLKALLQDAYGQDMNKIFRIRAFDTDDRLPEVQGSNGQSVRLSEADEYLNIGYVPTSNILKNLANYPEIRRWLPPDLPLQSIVQGARMVRMLGRLSLFYHYHKVVDRLTPALRDLRHLALPETSVGRDARAGYSTGLNVFLVSSVCGGTGAGTFLDMAYIVRELARRNVGIMPEWIFVNGILVLPSAFPTVRQQTRLKANALGCLEDLDTLIAQGYHEVFPGNQVISFKTRPFTVCYLVDATNKNGYTVKGLDELAPMLATGIFLQIASQVGPATKSRWDNVEETGFWFNGHPTAYSGLGCSRLVFPADTLIEQYRRRYAVTFIQEDLLRSEEAEVDVSALLSSTRARLGLGQDEILAALEVQEDERRKSHLNLDGRRILAGATVDELPERVRRAVARADRFLSDEFRPLIEANHRQLLTTWRRELRRLLDETAANPGYGVPGVLVLAARIGQEVDRLVRDVDEARQDLERQLGNVRQQIDQYQGQLRKAMESRIPILRGRDARSAAEALLAAEDRRVDTQVRLWLHQEALGLLSEARQVVEDERRRYSGLRERLSRLVQVFQDQIPLYRPDYESLMHRPVIEPEDEEILYRRYLPQSNQVEAAQRLLGPISDWTEWAEHVLEQKLLDFAGRPFQPLREVHIERYIQEKAAQEGTGEDPANAWLQRLRHLAAAFWNWEKGRGIMGDDPMVIRVLGVPTVEDSIFQGKQESGEELVTTNYPLALSALHTEHGLPYIALAGYTDFVQAYENYIQTNRDREGRVLPIRLFPEGAVEESVDTLYLRFAQGLILGHIYVDEQQDFYFRSASHHVGEDGAQAATRLSRDLRYAIEALGEHPNFLRQIEYDAKRFTEQYGFQGVSQEVEKAKERWASYREDEAFRPIWDKLFQAMDQWARASRQDTATHLQA